MELKEEFQKKNLPETIDGDYEEIYGEAPQVLPAEYLITFVLRLEGRKSFGIAYNMARRYWEYNIDAGKRRLPKHALETLSRYFEIRETRG